MFIETLSHQSHFIVFLKQKINWLYYFDDWRTNTRVEFYSSSDALITKISTIFRLTLEVWLVWQVWWIRACRFRIVFIFNTTCVETSLWKLYLSNIKRSAFHAFRLWCIRIWCNNHFLLFKIYWTGENTFWNLFPPIMYLSF